MRARYSRIVGTCLVEAIDAIGDYLAARRAGAQPK
jgi:hypothetical protein